MAVQCSRAPAIESKNPQAVFEELFRRDRHEEVHRAGDHSGPSGLMAGAEAGAVVPVEVFVKLETIAPVRIILELPRAAVHGPVAVFVAQEYAREAARDFFGDLIERHPPARPGGALDRKIVSKVSIVLQQ